MTKTNKPGLDNQSMSDGQTNRLIAVRILVGSQLPSDVRRGLGQLRSLLSENNEDLDVYALLLLAAKNNPSYREEIHALIQEHEQRGSRAAGAMMQELVRQAIPVDPGNAHADIVTSASEKPQNLMYDADDAYYAAEFQRAIELYRQVLSNEPDNQRARQQLDKAELNLLSKKSGQDLPREAMQYYRRARSFIAARDVKSAISLLEAAIEIAKAHGTSFPEAEDVIASQNNLEVAVEYKQEAENFIANAQWEQTAERYEKALNLDPTDGLTRDLCERSKDLLEAEALLLSLAETLELQDRKEKLETIVETIRSAERIYDIAKSDRFRALRTRHRIYKAEFDFQASRFKGLAKGQLSQALSAGRNVLAANDPAVVYATEQLTKHGRASFLPFWILFIMVLAVTGISLGGWRIVANMISNTPERATAITLTHSLFLSLTPTLSLTKSTAIPLTPTPTFTSSMTFTISPAPSSTITPTQPGVLETAYVTAFVLHAQDAPNGKWIDELTHNQVVVCSDKQIVAGQAWYSCSWEKNASSLQGWILGDFLSFVPPTETPTVTPTN